MPNSNFMVLEILDCIKTNKIQILMYTFSRKFQETVIFGQPVSFFVSFGQKFVLCDFEHDFKVCHSEQKKQSRPYLPER